MRKDKITMKRAFVIFLPHLLDAMSFPQAVKIQEYREMKRYTAASAKEEYMNRAKEIADVTRGVSQRAHLILENTAQYERQKKLGMVEKHRDWKEARKIQKELLRP